MDEFTNCQICLDKFDSRVHIPLLLEKCKSSTKQYTHFQIAHIFIKENYNLHT